MATAEVDSIRTVLNYTNDIGKRGMSSLDPNVKVPDNLDEESNASCLLECKNARRFHNPKMNTMGFELVKQKCPLREADFYHDDKIKKIYYPEVEALICGVTGAKQCIAFHHMVRLADPKARNAPHAGGGKTQGPAASVHVDYTCRNSLNLFDGLAPKDMRKGRFIVINAWRNISDTNPIVNDHLAMCDASSVVAPDDFVPWDVVQQSGDISETYRLEAGHASRHRWYYYPNMVRDEVLLFMQYDSNPSTNLRYTFHSSVKDPNATQNLGRMSLELRTIAFFPDHTPSTIPENHISGGAIIRRAAQKVLGAIAHADHWDQKGREWMGRDLYRAGGAEATAKILVGQQTNSRTGEPLSAEEQKQVVESLIKGGYEAQAKAAFPQIHRPPDVFAATKFMEAVEHVDKWDAGGRSWATGLANSNGGGRAGAEALARGMAQGASNAGHFDPDMKGCGPDLQNKVVTLLMQDPKWLETVRRKLPPPADPAGAYVNSIVNSLQDVKSWGGGYTWAKGCTARGAFREMAQGLVDNALKEGHHGMKGVSPAIAQDVVNRLSAPGSAFIAGCQKYCV